MRSKVRRVSDRIFRFESTLYFGVILNFSPFLSLKVNLSTFREAQVEWGPGCLSWLSQLAQVGWT